MTASASALKRITVDELTIRRVRSGRGFSYVQPNGRPLRDPRTLFRLKRLAVPPAYDEVVFAVNTRAHIQAMGIDSAGRRQYRYHPEWEKVRETRKAKRLTKLVQCLPSIRRALTTHLNGAEPTREAALAAVIDLIACTALRPGSESYAREHGTRGASTLLKSNVTLTGDKIRLKFRGKGGLQIDKELRSRRLVRVFRGLMLLPGKRLFQYRHDDGSVRKITRGDVNAFLQSLTPEKITLKDFRTMIACSCALTHLADLTPKPSQRGRRKQVKAALRAVADELVNTPAVCAKSYVHTALVDAFESGALARMSKRAGRPVSAAGRERLLAAVLRAN
jgi:DNA topoisomerase-1